MNPNNPNTSILEEQSASYPSPRYFQIHFESIQEELKETRRCLADLQKQMAELRIALSHAEEIDDNNVVHLRCAKHEVNTANHSNS